MQKLMEKKNIQLRQVPPDELYQFASSSTHNRIDKRGIYALDEHDEMIAFIPLTQGQIAKIDANMIESCVTRNWCAKWEENINGYYAVSITSSGGRHALLYLHRYMYEYVNGPIDYGMQIDHINGDTLDERLVNLRIVTHRENQSNRHCHRQGKLVGCRCIRSYGVWRAEIQQNNVQYHIGMLPSEQIAHDAYLYVCEQIQSGMSPREAIMLYQLCADATDNGEDGDR